MPPSLSPTALPEADPAVVQALLGPLRTIAPHLDHIRRHHGHTEIVLRNHATTRGRHGAFTTVAEGDSHHAHLARAHHLAAIAAEQAGFEGAIAALWEAMHTAFGDSLPYTDCGLSTLIHQGEDCLGLVFGEACLVCPRTPAAPWHLAHWLGCVHATIRAITPTGPMPPSGPVDVGRIRVFGPGHSEDDRLTFLNATTGWQPLFDADVLGQAPANPT